MKEKKKFILKNRFFALLFVAVTLFMGIGYASVNSVMLDINGTVIAKEQEGIYIKNVEYLSDTGADLDSSKINKYYQTMLNSTISLSSTDINSSITYRVTIYNNSDDKYFFKNVTLMDEFYDNNDISYSLDGIGSGDIVTPYSTITFSLTFKYSDSTSVINNNILNSYLNFRFVKPANMKSAGNGYSGEFWNYKSSITNIVFQNEISDIDGAISFDVSEEGDGTAMSRLVSNGDSTYTLYLQSDSVINAPVDSSYLFDGFTKLQNIENINYLETSKVKNMSYMFSNNKSLTTLDLSSFDTSNVTTMSYMFNYDSSMSYLNVSGFDTSNVTRMEWMFQACSKLTTLDVSSFNTGKVTNMGFMFFNCSSLISLDVSKFDTGNVTNMTYMFDGLHTLTNLDVNNFNTSKVTDMSFMFYDCPKLVNLDLSNFDTSRVSNMSYMLASLSSITDLDLSNFNTSNVTNMAFMFMANSKLVNLNISNFDTSKVKNMSYMFFSCSKLETLDLSNFDMSRVTSTNSMLGDTGSIKNAYARTEEDAAILNAIDSKPTTYTFIVK